MSPEADETATPRRERGFNPLLGLLVLVLMALLVAGGWALWTFVGTSELARRAAADEMAELRTTWREMADTRTEEPRMVTNPEPGTTHWLIRIPDLDPQHQWPVVVGVDPLDSGVGWYPGTAQPGQVGNFAVSGHQITHGEPFAGWERLGEGDQVMVESVDAVYTYTLMTSAGDLTVSKDDDWVLDPVPGRDDIEATQAFITLITHEDFNPTPDRSVIFGVLTSTEPK